MANGGGSRIGGFFRGVLVGLVVCAIAAVALSLSAPVPERAVPQLEGTAVEGAGTGPVAEPEAVLPQAATAPAADPATAVPGSDATPEAEGDATQEAEVIVVPAEEPAGAAEPAAPAGENAAPQATWPQGAPATSEAEPPAAADGEFSAPQDPNQ